ncbi:MAG: flagellar hook-length control protein FliK [Candidatus Riflebacteria bacterium]|nr:flagellar hook-length control protein FliK [Candidatus Riflebacteria bacterium]
MNNDLLAGILGGLTGQMPLSMPKKDNNSEPGDFMAMLFNRLAGDSDVSMSSNSGKSEQSSPYTGVGAYNPLLSVKSGSSDNMRSELGKKESVTTGFSNDSFQAKLAKRLDNTDSEKKASQADDSEARRADTIDKAKQANDDKEACACSKKEAASDEAKLAASAEAELTAEAAANEAIKNSELEKLLSAFSPEDKAALIEVLQRLSPEDLEALAQSPDEFNQELLKMVMEMPNSSAKDELLAMVESPEFLQLMQGLADQQASSENQATSMGLQMASLTTGQDTDNETNNAGQTTSEATATDLSTSNVNSSTESSDTEKQGNAEADESQSDRKTATKNTNEKNVETHQESASAEPKRSEESLREEFKRLNQSANEATSENQQSETGDEPVIANKSTNQTLTAQPATPEQTKTAVEEAAKKFFTLFSEKSSVANKSTEAATYSPEAIKRHSNTSNNSAGNGNNGFSSHTGTSASSMSSAKPATPVPAANQIFSQMLEKAEYLKTQNGSKILNMEINPGELGKLEMELTSKDGTLSARISAESALAKARLDELAPQIKEQLLSQGVNLTEITVDISSKNPDERSRDQMSGGQNKSTRILAANKDAAEAIIRKNILPNLRRAALNIKAVDLTV